MIPLVQWQLPHRLVINRTFRTGFFTPKGTVSGYTRSRAVASTGRASLFSGGARGIPSSERRRWCSITQAARLRTKSSALALDTRRGTDTATVPSPRMRRLMFLMLFTVRKYSMGPKEVSTRRSSSAMDLSPPFSRMGHPQSRIVSSLRR